MKIITGYRGEPHITAQQDGALNAGIIGAGNYVLNVGSVLAATIESNNEVRIADGVLVMNGRAAIIEAGTYEPMTIQNGARDYNRIDLIVATYEMAGDGTESVTLEVIQGEPSTGTPVEPSYTTGNILTGATFAQVPLYAVRLTGISIESVTSKIPTATYPVNTLAEIQPQIATLTTGFGQNTQDITGLKGRMNNVVNMLNDVTSTNFELSLPNARFPTVSSKGAWACSVGNLAFVRIALDATVVSDSSITIETENYEIGSLPGLRYIPNTTVQERVAYDSTGNNTRLILTPQGKIQIRLNNSMQGQRFLIYHTFCFFNNYDLPIA